MSALSDYFWKTLRNDKVDYDPFPVAQRALAGTVAKVACRPLCALFQGRLEKPNSIPTSL